MVDFKVYDHWGDDQVRTVLAARTELLNGIQAGLEQVEAERDRLVEALRDVLTECAPEPRDHLCAAPSQNTYERARAVLAECAGTPNNEWRHNDGTVRVDHMDARPGDYFGTPNNEDA